MKTPVTSVILTFLVSFTQAQNVAITNVNVVDVRSGKLVAGQTVIITNEKISAVGSNQKSKPAPGAVVIDGTGKYLMPGLIDSHVHFFQSGSLYTRPDAVDFRDQVPYEKERADGLNNTSDYFARYLRLGITTVMDVGGPFSNFLVRDSITKTTTSPRVLVTGPLFSIVDRPQLALNDPPIIKIMSEADVDALFSKMLPYKPDFIKIWYIAGSQYPAEKSFPLVKHVAKRAAENKLRLAVHSTELKTARLAVEAGATILVHSVEDEVIPDDFVKTLREKKVTLIPTLIVGANYVEVFSGRLPHHPQDLRWANAKAYGTLMDIEAMDSAKLPTGIRQMRRNGIPKRVAARDSVMKLNVRKLVSGGVNIATGTDAGNIGTLHASSYIQELEAMQAAGLSIAEVLRASTIHAAAGFDLADRIGSIEAGKAADLVMLTKNPLETLGNLNSIEWVARNGKIVLVDSILSERPEAVVQRQVNAYNARNIDEFIATYSTDIAIYNWDGTVRMKGHDAMRSRYGPFFTNTKNLHCHIENRIVQGNKIIDKERVRAGKRVIEAVAIYEVEKGKIKKVTFVE